MKLEIKNLSVEIENKKILDNFNMEINSGEIHAIMGPNGVGKSTLSRVIMGDLKYKVIYGEILYDNKMINGLVVYSCIFYFAVNHHLKVMVKKKFFIK